MDTWIGEQLDAIYMIKFQQELLFGRNYDMRSDEVVMIDPIDMNLVQNLITAVNESKLPQEVKEEIRTTLDRWQNACMISSGVRVVI